MRRLVFGLTRMLIHLVDDLFDVFGVVDRAGNVESEVFCAADDVGDVVAAAAARQDVPGSAAGFLQAVESAAELVDRASENIAEMIEIAEDVTEMAAAKVFEGISYPAAQGSTRLLAEAVPLSATEPSAIASWSLSPRPPAPPRWSQIESKAV